MAPAPAPKKDFAFGSGTTRANDLPRFIVYTVSPDFSHSDNRLKSFRSSRTVAVLMVNFCITKPNCQSIALHPTLISQ